MATAETRAQRPQQGLDGSVSPCCGAPVVGQSRPKHETETVADVSHGRVIETDIQVRRQGGLCGNDDCKNELVREAPLGKDWRPWRRERWPPDA